MPPCRYRILDEAQPATVFYWRNAKLICERRVVRDGWVYDRTIFGRQVFDQHGELLFAERDRQKWARAFAFEPAAGPDQPLYLTIFEAMQGLQRFELTRTDLDAMVGRVVGSAHVTALRLPVTYPVKRVRVTAATLGVWSYDPVRHELLPRHADGTAFGAVLRTASPVNKAAVAKEPATRTGRDQHPDTERDHVLVDQLVQGGLALDKAILQVSRLGGSKRNRAVYARLRRLFGLEGS